MTYAAKTIRRPFQNLSCRSVATCAVAGAATQ